MLAQPVSRSDFVDPLSIWAERDDRARLVIGDDLGIRWRNRAATRFIEESRLFNLFRDRLAPRDGRWAQPFQQFVRSSGAEVSAFCLPCPSNERVLCTALSLGDDANGRTTGLTMRYAAGAAPLHGAAVQSAFHLTLSERRVVEMMFAGRTAEEVGLALGVAIGTIRVHIRHIYEKLSVGSREAMFHRLAPFLSA